VLSLLSLWMLQQMARCRFLWVAAHLWARTQSAAGHVVQTEAILSGVSGGWDTWILLTSSLQTSLHRESKYNPTILIWLHNK
jgi:hypothetical protein